MSNITFITGNAHKAAHFSQQMGFEVPHVKLELDEIQSKSSEEIIEHKVRQAYERIKKPILVDDFSAWFDDYSGLPGPFIKFFIDAEDGLEKLCRIADALPTRRMTQKGYIGYFDGETLRIFSGELHGDVVDHPRVPSPETGAFGTDAIFAPDGYEGRTRAELSADEYQKVYREVRAVDEVRAFLKNRTS